MPWNPTLYPDNWEEIAMSCKDRAGWKCEQCGWTHGDVRIGKKYGKPYKDYLAVAHINHDPSDNQDENLKALCQRCHLQHDIEQHVISCRRTKQRKHREAQIEAGQLVMFE